MNKTKNKPYDALSHFNATLDNAYFDNSLSKDDIVFEMEKYADAKNAEMKKVLQSLVDWTILNTSSYPAVLVSAMMLLKGKKDGQV